MNSYNVFSLPKAKIRLFKKLNLFLNLKIILIFRIIAYVVKYIIKIKALECEK